VQNHVRRYSSVMLDTKFQRPTCDALYELVRVEAPPNHDRREQVLCLGCGGPLRNREGKFALKHFRVGGSRRPISGWAKVKIAMTWKVGFPQIDKAGCRRARMAEQHLLWDDQDGRTD
jgi:hypothetical protein